MSIAADSSLCFYYHNFAGCEKSATFVAELN